MLPEITSTIESLTFPTLEGLSDETVKVYAELFASTARRQQQEDDEIRNNPHMKIILLQLIPALNDLIGDLITDEVRESLGVNHGHYVFATDKAGDLILWQLMEFLLQAQIDRHDSEYDNLVKYAQMTRWNVAEVCEIRSASNFPNAGRTYTATGENAQGEEVSVSFTDHN